MVDKNLAGNLGVSEMSDWRKAVDGLLGEFGAPMVGIYRLWGL